MNEQETFSKNVILSTEFNKYLQAQRDNNIEMFKFLVERAHAEASLFYIRNGVFLSLQVVVIGQILKGILDGSIVSSSSAYLVKWVSIVGLIVSAIWLFVNHKSVCYNRAWLADARNLRDKDAFLRDTIMKSLGTPGIEKFLETPDLEDKKPNRLAKVLEFLGLRTCHITRLYVTEWFQILAVGTIVIWIPLFCFLRSL